jgi:hypothetical protein
VPAAYCLRATRGNLVAVRVLRLAPTMPPVIDHGALDLALSVGYSVLLLVLIGVSYLSLTRRTKRK